MKINKICLQSLYVSPTKSFNEKKQLPPKENFNNNYQVICLPKFTGVQQYQKNIFDIIGHLEEKEKIYNLLIKPIISGREKPPAALLIYSPTREVTNFFTSSILKKLKPFCNITIFNDKTLQTDFKTWVLNALQANSIKNAKHNIILIPDIERYLAMRPEDFRVKNFNAKDKEILVKITDTYRRFPSLFKSLTDYCSEPVAKNGHATTFIFTSENPHFIDADLLNRPGKFLTFPVNPETSKDITMFFEETVNKYKIYFKNLCQNPGVLGEKPISFSLVEKILTEKDKILSNINSITDVPYNIITEFAVPNLRFGGYSYKKLFEMVKHAIWNIVVYNNKNNFGEILAANIRKTERDVPPETYKNFLRIKNLISIKSDRSVITPKEIYENMFDINLLPEPMQKGVNRYVMSEFVKLASCPHCEESKKFLKIYSDVNNKSFRENFNNYISSHIIPYANGKCRLYYGERGDQIIDLYLGSFGWEKRVLWVASENPKDIKLVKYLSEGIKNFKEFKEIEFIDFPKANLNGIPNDPLARKTIDGKEIGRISIMHY